MVFNNRNVTVIGLGDSGVNAALLLKKTGASVKVTDSGDAQELKKVKVELESKGIEVEIGSHTEDFIKGQDLVVVSPGVENSSPAMKWAVQHKIPIIGEMELGYAFCKGRIIAITGTNGKSTVTTLIGDILKAGGKDAVVCGNIGNCLCGEISRIKKDTWVVLEVSSAQLENVSEFKPKIAVVLNITDDHMDRYKNFYEYFNEKLKIFSRQDENDILVLNYDADNLRRLKGLARSSVLFYGKELRSVSGYNISAFVKGGNISCSYDGTAKDILPVSGIRLKGVHNLENVIVSSLVGTIAGVGPDSIARTVGAFTGLEHRFETVDTVDGIEYIDDSKSTTVDSTKRALESCTKPVVLIAGGKDKYSDYGIIKNTVRQKVKNVVLIGQAAKAIKKALGDAAPVSEADKMSDAVDVSHKLAKSGWIVLLSPMCSSFDMFKNYKERGKAFKEAVGRIASGRQTIKT